jgi:hypothetical protein
MSVDLYNISKDIGKWVKGRKVKRYTINQFYHSVDWFTSNELKMPKLSKKQKDELLEIMRSHDPQINVVSPHGRTYVVVGDIKKKLLR